MSDNFDNNLIDDVLVDNNLLNAGNGNEQYRRSDCCRRCQTYRNTFVVAVDRKKGPKPLLQRLDSYKHSGLVL